MLPWLHIQFQMSSSALEENRFVNLDLLHFREVTALKPSAFSMTTSCCALYTQVGWRAVQYLLITGKIAAFLSIPLLFFHVLRIGLNVDPFPGLIIQSPVAFMRLIEGTDLYKSL